jgi:hypothetical protein
MRYIHTYELFEGIYTPTSLDVDKNIMSYQQPAYRIVRDAKERDIFPKGYDGIINRSTDGGVYEIILRKDVANLNITGRVKNMRGDYVHI